MAEEFDPYHKWLGISPDKQPPNYYQLLAVDDYESDPDVIEAAADQRMSHLRKYQTGKNAKLSQKLLNEISAARIALLNPDKKAAYDEQLRRDLGGADTADPLGPAFDPLGGGTGLPGPASFEPQPTPSHAAPPISTKKPTLKRKPVWVLPVAISVGALVILGAVIAVIVASSTDAGTERTVAEPSGEKQTDPSGNDNIENTVHSDASKDESNDDEPTDNVAADPNGEANDQDESSSPFETIGDPATKKETGAQNPDVAPETPTGPDDQTKPIESEGPKKQPLPTNEQQAPVLATLEETFKLSKKRTSDEALKLAEELFELAGQTNDPVEKFVLLRGTMRYAGEGGDARLLMQAVNAIDRDFEIDRLGIAQQALIGFAGLASAEEHFGSLAQATTQFITDAVAEDRVDLAHGLAEDVYTATLTSAPANYRKQFYEQKNESRNCLRSRNNCNKPKPS